MYWQHDIVGNITSRLPLVLLSDLIYWHIYNVSCMWPDRSYCATWKKPYWDV